VTHLGVARFDAKVGAGVHQLCNPNPAEFQWDTEGDATLSETTTTDELKTKIKRLAFEASQVKCDLHDLSEELPSGWEQIMQVAERTYKKYAELAAARQQLAEIEKSVAG
jgi:hypothetical protein